TSSPSELLPAWVLAPRPPQPSGSERLPSSKFVTGSLQRRLQDVRGGGARRQLPLCPIAASRKVTGLAAFIELSCTLPTLLFPRRNRSRPAGESSLFRLRNFCAAALVRRSRSIRGGHTGV